MKTSVVELLTWACRDELIKRDVQGYGEGWAGIEAYGDRGGFDAPPPVRAPAALGAPHPDALVVDRVLKALPPVRLADDLDAARKMAALLLGPVAGLVTGEQYRGQERKVAEDRLMALARRAHDPRPLLQSLALGVIKPPAREHWSVEPLRDGRGRIVETGIVWRKETVRLGGRTARLQVMVSGATPVRWLPEPLGVLEERLRWCVIVDGLEQLMAGLGRELVLWQVTGLGVAVAPWRGDLRPVTGVVLPDLAGPVVAERDWRKGARKMANKTANRAVRSNSMKTAKTQQLAP
jgi:hypothetical protein